MSDAGIQGSGPGGYRDVGQSAKLDSSSTTGAGKSLPVQEIDALKGLTESMTTFETEGTQNVNGPSGKGSRPRIAAPKRAISLDDLRFMLQVLTSNVEQATAETDVGRVKEMQGKIKQMALDIAKKYDEQLKANEKAEKAGKKSKLMGWIMKAVAVVTTVLAVVATVATFGLGAPALLACAGAVGAMWAMGDQIAQDKGMSAGSIPALLEKAGVAIAKRFVSGEAAEKLGKQIGGVLVIAACVPPMTGIGMTMIAVDPSVLGMAAASVASLCGSGEEQQGYVNLAFTIVASIGVAIVSGAALKDASSRVAKGVLGASETFKKANVFMSISSQTASVTTQGAQSGLQIDQALLDKVVAGISAELATMNADRTRSQTTENDFMDWLRKVAQAIDKGTSDLMDFLLTSQHAASAVSDNINDGVTI